MPSFSRHDIESMSFRAAEKFKEGTPLHVSIVKIAKDKHNCVIGSVDGVNIAPSIVEPNTTYFQSVNIFLPDNIPVKPKISCTIGI